jgi:NAD(P)-dependent dehydrogenase (short-subunit alcohol dehydrogenase family)
MENAFGQPQNVVVLGGSSDIARAITRQLCAARAHTVILAGRNPERLEVAAAEAREFGATTTGVVLFDAEDPSNAARTVTESFDKVGEQVDLVVLAVGMLGDQSADEDDAAAAARVATVNFTWPVAALAEVRRRLVAQGGGRILVITSVSGIRVRRTMYLYGGPGRPGPPVRRAGRFPRGDRRDPADTARGRRAHQDDGRSRRAALHHGPRRGGRVRHEGPRERRAGDLEPADTALRLRGPAPPAPANLPIDHRSLAVDGRRC